MPWSKLPFRDPNERISRVGQGFSKMLSMINTESLTKFDAKTASQTEGHMLSQGDMKHYGADHSAYTNSIRPQTMSRLASANRHSKNSAYSRATPKPKLSKNKRSSNRPYSQYNRGT